MKKEKKGARKKNTRLYQKKEKENKRSGVPKLNNRGTGPGVIPKQKGAP